MDKNNEKGIIFETESVLKETIVLTQERFTTHIVKRHPEMLGHQNDIKKTLEDPNVVYKPKRYPETRKYYARRTNKNEISEYNNVVVEFDEDQIGYVKTSYYSKELGGGGGNYVYFKHGNSI